jgi:hypothetical protein
MQVTKYTAPPYAKILYPHSRQYPIDEVCEKIVRALEKRNWKIPGIQIEFDDNGTGKEKYSYVSKIKGEDFKLYFCRIQGRLSAWRNDIAAINEMVIPKRELHVYEDESGPTSYTYVGHHWEADKDSFMNNSKVFSKRNGKPRTYLQYTGRANLESTRHYLHERNIYLVNDDDLGREYKAEGEEPKYFHTDQVFQEVKDWLTANVLKKIESFDETTKIELSSETAIPYPQHVVD